MWIRSTFNLLNYGFFLKEVELVLDEDGTEVNIRFTVRNNYDFFLLLIGINYIFN